MIIVEPFAFTHFMTPWMLFCRKLPLLFLIVGRKTPMVMFFSSLFLSKQFHLLSRSFSVDDLFIYYIHLQYSPSSICKTYTYFTHSILCYKINDYSRHIFFEQLHNQLRIHNIALDKGKCKILSQLIQTKLFQSNIIVSIHIINANNPG